VGADETLPDLRRSFEQLLQLNPQYILPSHGGTTSPTLLEQNIDYFDRLEVSIKKAIASGKVPPDWKERSDLPALLGLPYEKVIPANLTPSDGSSPFGTTFYQECHLKAVRATVASII